MQAIILAAGESSRFWPLNYRHKSLIKTMGRPLIWYTIKNLGDFGIKDIIIVQDKLKEIERELNKYSFKSTIRYVVQSKPKGMGETLLKAEKFIKDQFFIVNPYHFEAGRLMREMIGKSKKTGSSLILAGKKTSSFWNYGILDLNGDRALGLIEKPRKSKKSSIRVIGIYLLPRDFFGYYKRTSRGQYAFEDALDLYMKEKNVRTVITKQETPSLKYPWDLLGLSKLLMNRFLVTKTNKSARISKRAVIGNNVYIGKGVKVFEGAVIKDFCYIGDNCIIGNNAIVREHTDLENNIIVGANAEITRSIIQEGTHVHSGFFGDSIIGENCRVGAGVVVANRRFDRRNISSVVKDEKIDTGLTFLGTVIGRDTAIGINAGFMPGIFVGSNCIVGPGSLIFGNIPDKKFVRLGRQVMKITDL
ncbi:MAG: sugar phosphate nucleotidyltransferase [bacterium]|nr:sugar phosphate nucleotidyltransferase [bacterium]